jgi:hypothetical protein
MLRAREVETYESYQGGPGHAFPEPTVRFHGGSSGGAAGTRRPPLFTKPRRLPVKPRSPTFSSFLTLLAESQPVPPPLAISLRDKASHTAVGVVVIDGSSDLMVIVSAECLAHGPLPYNAVVRFLHGPPVFLGQMPGEDLVGLGERLELTLIGAERSAQVLGAVVSRSVCIQEIVVTYRNVLEQLQDLDPFDD